MCKKKSTVSYTVELAASEAGDDFDGVVIPGGSAPEGLRVNEDVVRFVKEPNEKGSLISVICHGPQIMISSDVLKGKATACYIGIRDDVKLAGAELQRWKK
ncbi:DJ-1/PfpI family protein [Bacillus sp. AK128]